MCVWLKSSSMMRGGAVGESRTGIIYSCMHVHVCVYTYVHMYVCLCMHTYVCLPAYTHVCIHQRSFVVCRLFTREARERRAALDAQGKGHGCLAKSPPQASKSARERERYMYVCIYIYIYIRVCMHIYTYIF